MDKDHVANVSVDEITGIPIITLGFTIDIYPNPTTSELNFEITGMPDQEAQIDLFNHLGQRIKSQQVSGSTAKMDLTLFPEGLYYYVLKGKQGESIKSGKFVLMR